MMELFDTHAHLALLEHSTSKEAIARAHSAGVSRMVSVSTKQEDWEKNKRVAIENSQIWYSLGVHPHEAKDYAAGETRLLDYFKNNQVPEKCVAIGELGLDYHYNLSPREVQLEAIRKQFELAKTVNLPVIIHCRDAFDDLYEVLTSTGVSPRGGIMHCFTGNAEQAKRCLDFGLKISFSGILTFKNAEPLREAARIVPKSELLIETDCPFLAPVPLRGKPNEPSFLPHTAQKLADLQGCSLEEIAQRTTENAIELFQVQ